MRVQWTEAAISDLTSICDYSRDHMGDKVARETALRIHDSVASLPQFPQRGRVGRKVGTRELVLPDLPFLAIYRIRVDSIEVIRILHGAQRWP